MQSLVELTEQELIDLNRARQGRADIELVPKTLTEDERREIHRLRGAYTGAGYTQIIELSDVELQEVHQLRRDLEEERIFKIMRDGADMIQELRNYLKYLRHRMNCPPRIIHRVQNEILKLATEEINSKKKK